MALNNCTDAEIEANYVGTHGASVVGFAFTELLSFRLLPRLKNIGSIRLCRPDDVRSCPCGIAGQLGSHPLVSKRPVARASRGPGDGSLRQKVSKTP
ncbi:Tn3 family transposase [Streptomyces sp. NPDC001817]|uniref:Tn3 family transposase n=1 Tax=Streptomyces sp. NPDC001817 TaxID=3154398 RepID=UPI0033178A8D